MEGGPWGVVIVACAFMIQVISFGTESTIGVYNIEFLEYFKDQTVGVSLIGSINFGVYLASGPIVSLMMTKFSYRKIALGGSFLVVTGLLGMRIYPYIPTMCFFFGVLTGFGNCCVYIPSHVLSGLYYEEYRSLATGISNSGSGLGGAVMPVLVGISIDVFSWKGSLVILAGLNLHLFIFCALLRKPPGMSSWHVIEMEMEVIPTSHCNGGDIVSFSDLETDLETPTDSRHILRKTSPSIIISGTDDSSANLQIQDLATDDEHSFNVLWGFNRHKLTVTDSESFRTRSISSQGFGTDNSNHLSSACPSPIIFNADNRVMLKSQSFVQPSTRRCETRHLLFDFDLRSTSLQPVVMGWRGSCAVRKDDTPKMSTVDLRNRLQIEEKTHHFQNPPKSSQHIFIFTNYGFDVYFVSNMMWNAGYTIIQSFAPEFMIQNGLTSMEASWLSGAFGFGSFIGGVLGACFGNMKRVDRKLLYALANVAMGVMILMFPNYNHIAFYAVTLIMSGLAFGVILGLLVIVLTDLVGPYSLGNGIGYLMLSNGVGAFVGPPIASLLREKTGEFTAGIFLAGSLCIMGGLVMLLMPCVWCDRKTGQDENNGTKDNTCDNVTHL